MSATDSQKSSQALPVCLVLVALGIVALPYLPWLAGGILPKIQAGSFWLLLIIVLMLVFAGLKRRFITAVVLALCLVTGLLPQLQLVPAATAQRNNAELKVLSFNTYKAQAVPAQLAELIIGEEPDVLVLVETSEQLHERLTTLGALEGFGYRTALAPAGGERDTVIFSRFPLTETSAGLTSAETGWVTMPTVSLDVDGQQVSLAGVHVYPPLGQAKAWTQGLDAVAHWIGAHKQHPTIVAGDFNATRAHPQYRKASDGLSESTGLVPRSTWPATDSPTPLIEIDHIISSGFTVLDTSTTRISGSDHLAILASLQLN